MKLFLLISIVLQTGTSFSQNEKDALVMTEPFVPKTNILKKECQPDKYSEIEEKVFELEDLYEKSFKIYQINKTKKYRFLYSIQNYTGIQGNYHGSYYGESSDIINGKKIYELYDALENNQSEEGSPVLFNDKFVVIRGEYSFIGAINRHYTIAYYLEMIE